MAVLRKIINFMLGNYSLYRIYRLDVNALSPLPPPSEVKIMPITDPDVLEASDSLAISNLTDYAGAGAYGFAAMINDEIAAVLWVWDRERYRQRNFWPLQAREAKIVDFHTHERFTHKGLLVLLIQHAASVMRTHHCDTLYARVWHSDVETQAAMIAAGMRYHAFVTEFFLCGSAKALRFVRYESQ